MKVMISGLAAVALLLFGQATQAQVPAGPARDMSEHVQGTDIKRLVPSLRQGGYVIVFRHMATDPSQVDVYPLDFSDTSKQRLLSDYGRQGAQMLGEAFAILEIPIGRVYASRLFRALETAGLIAHKDVVPDDRLNDSDGPGSAGGGDAASAAALRALVTAAPDPGTNTVIVTHAGNMRDAFGPGWADMGEGEAAIFKPDGSAEPVPVLRVGPGDWVALSNGHM